MEKTQTSSKKTYKNFLVESYPHIAKSLTLKAGNNFKPFMVIGKKTSGGDLVPSVKSVSDGSEVPYAVVLEAVDLSGSGATDTASLCLMAGQVNEGKLTFGTGHDADSVRDALRQVGIYLTPYKT